MRLQSHAIGHSDQTAAGAPARFVLIVEPLPGTDPIRVLRFVLKRLKHQCGLRCVTLREIDPIAGLSTAALLPPHAIPNTAPLQAPLRVAPSSSGSCS